MNQQVTQNFWVTVFAIFFTRQLVMMLVTVDPLLDRVVPAAEVAVLEVAVLGVVVPAAAVAAVVVVGEGEAMEVAVVPLIFRSMQVSLIISKKMGYNLNQKLCKVSLMNKF